MRSGLSPSDIYTPQKKDIRSTKSQYEHLFSESDDSDTDKDSQEREPEQNKNQDRDTTEHLPIKFRDRSFIVFANQQIQALTENILKQRFSRVLRPFIPSCGLEVFNKNKSADTKDK